MAALPSRRIMPLIYACIAAFGVALSSVALIRDHALVIALLAVCGGAMVVGVALCNTSIQQRVPDAMRGRVLSMYTFAFFGFLPFGQLIAGILAEHNGLAPAMLFMAVGTVVAVGIAVPALGRAKARPTLGVDHGQM